jgi:hypothetical protein
MSRSAVATFTLLVVAGCDGPGGRDGYGAGGLVPGDHAAEELSGEYRLISRFDLTAAGLLPDLANDTLRALSGLQDSPARTMIDLLHAAHVPIVSTVLGFVPSSIRSQFEELIDRWVFDRVLEGLPSTQHLATIIDELATNVTQFPVVSRLVIADPEQNGSTLISHRITGLAFLVDGVEWVVEFPEIASELTQVDGIESRVAHVFENAPGLEDGRLNLGSHTFGVPVGELALAGIDAKLYESLGASDLRAALGLLVDCMCESGVDLVADQVIGQVRAIRIDLFRLTAGEAAMFDAPEPEGAIDGKIDRIERGTWQLTFSGPAGERSVPGTFTGRRLAAM